MDIKKQSHILKQRAKELGYDIKLTHAQEIISALEGYKSRHSALLQDSKKTETKKEVEKNLNFYLENKPLPEDNFLLAETAFNIGIKLGREYIKPLDVKLNEIVSEAEILLNSKEKQKRIFNRSLDHGVLKYITSTLDVNPLRDYFNELEKRENLSSIGGLNEVQKVLKKRTKEMWERLSKNFGIKP